jgi:proliferating cell nuclear antigen
MDIDCEQLIIPTTEYASVVSFPSDEFQRIVRDLQSLGDTCTINASKDGIKFSVAGDAGSGGILLKTTTSGNNSGPTEVLVGNDVEMSFALRYLHLFSKAAPLSPTVTISMIDSQPMVVKYQIGGLGELSFYLAPKMEDEEVN